LGVSKAQSFQTPGIYVPVTASIWLVFADKSATTIRRTDEDYCPIPYL
jgi:hypothetical protein